MAHTYTPAGRRLRLLLALAGAAGGGAWGAIAFHAATQASAAEVFTGAAPTATMLRLLALLLSLPLGALLSARLLDFASHTWGRRPAILLSLLLLAIGCLLGAALPGMGQAGAAFVAGLGVGGVQIVSPKIAHELAERGHRRLIPRLAGACPAGAALALAAGKLGGALLPGEGRIIAWIVPILAALAAAELALLLPETPHWYVTQGKHEAAYEALRRMHGSLEAAIAIDWVVMDAGMMGEQRPLSLADMRVERLRRTVRLGLLLEFIQMLPLGLAAIVCTPALILAESPGISDGAAWLGIMAAAWVGLAFLALRRRPERLIVAWIFVGLGLAACGLLGWYVAEGLTGVWRSAAVVLVACLLVAAQYVCVTPACVGAVDPMVPPWLLRSQRRAEAAARPLLQMVTLGGLVLALGGGLPASAVILTCLGADLAVLLATLAFLPRLTAALR